MLAKVGFLVALGMVLANCAPRDQESSTDESASRASLGEEVGRNPGKSIAVTTYSDGPGSSGGGGAIVCQDGTGKKSAYLLDLWEAQYLRGMQLSTSSSPVDIQVAAAIDKLRLVSPTVAEKTAIALPLLFDNAESLPENLNLQPPSDAESQYGMGGCELKGMMYYDAELKRLRIDADVFARLASNTDIAAARVHEALYYVVRGQENLLPEKNSTPIRRLVGCLFSNSGQCLSIETLDDVLFKADVVLKCENQAFAYYLVKDIAHETSFWNECQGNPTADWVGVALRVWDETFPIPTYFALDYSGPNNGSKNAGSKGCSSLSRFGILPLSIYNFETTGDVSTGFPVLSRFNSMLRDTSYHWGSPKCTELK